MAIYNLKKFIKFMNPYQAIKYVPDLNFLEIFHNIGDSIRVFIPIDDIKLDSPALKNNKVYGSGPFSVNSDILAITVYMGILYPQKKPYWSNSSTCFSPEKEDDIRKLDYHLRIINDEFDLLGVIVTVIAEEPQPYYKSSQRYVIKSKEDDNDAPFSINIQKAFLAMSYEQPIIVDDYSKIVQRYVQPSKIERHGEIEGQFPYTREYFTIQTCLFLFKQYYAVFYTNSGNFMLKGDDSSNLKFFELDAGGEGSLVGDLSIDNIVFNDASISFDEFGTFEVFSFSIFQKTKE